MAVYVWWIGDADGDPAALETLRAQIAAAFETDVAQHVDAERPQGTLDARRGQHSSRGVLGWVLAHGPADATRVLAVTDRDLFMPVLTFVFGEAQLNGQAAVVSTARLHEPGRADIALARLVKESVHELGHTFGLLHCETPRCVMTRSASVRAVDVKQPRLCPACRDKYRAYYQEGLHVYREDPHPHRR